jgi:hypothetical protein
MKKAPSTYQASGALGEQLSFLPPPPFSPTLPNEKTLRFIALRAMSKAPITQIDWLKFRHGWRLAAIIKDLNYLGWQISSERQLSDGKSIAIYSLSEEAKSLLTQHSQGAEHE